MQGTISRSVQLAKESWAVLKMDKELVLFPIISGIATLILMALILVPAAFLSGVTSGNTDNQYIFYIFFFIYYFIASFVVIFFNTGLIACAQIRLQGGDPRFSDGLQVAVDNIGSIFFWSAINATVGLILRMIRERLGILGQIIAGIVGIAWNLITFFVIPVIIFEKISVIDSIKKSAHLFKKTWGENVVLRFSVAILFVLLGLAGIIPLALAGLTRSAAVIIPVGIVVFVYWIGLAIISASLNGIFAAALYDFASTGVVPSAFTPELIQNAFGAKPRGLFRR